MLLQLNHLVMVVRDLAACRVLYRGPLGLEEVGEGKSVGGACLFNVGPTLMELREDPAAPEPYQGEEREHPAINHIALYTGNIEDTYAALVDTDVGLQGPPQATELGHRNMQRSLLSFTDPNGFTVQISETIDPRDHLEGRRQAKRNMAAGTLGLFGGIDHIAMYCTDYAATRHFYAETLGLEEFFHSTTREEGTVVASGFEQGAFAVGGTDIEMASDDTWTAVRPGTVAQLGFSIADVDRAFGMLQESGVTPEGAPAEWSPCSGISRPAFTLRDPDGTTIQISQA